MNKIQTKFVIDAIEDPSKLTDWEYDFINTLADRDEDYELSPKENKILNIISQKYLN